MLHVIVIILNIIFIKDMVIWFASDVCRDIPVLCYCVLIHFIKWLFIRQTVYNISIS